MDYQLFRDLSTNAFLLLGGSIVFYLFFKHQKKIFSRILSGMSIGGLGILLILSAVEVAPGMLFDTRSILVSISGMFFGFVPTVAAVVVICIYRAILGGAGAFVGILITILTAGVGLLWNRLRYERIFSRSGKKYIEFYIVAFITQIVMLACLFTLPDGKALPLLEQISLPVLIIYPVCSLLISIMIYLKFAGLKTGIDLKQSELRFRALFEKAPIGIALASDRKFIYANAMLEEILGRTREEINNVGWKELTHPDDWDIDKAQMEDLQEGRIHSFSIVKRYLRPDHSVVWVNRILTNIELDKIHESNVLYMIQDITEVVEKSRNLQDSNERYKELYLAFQKKEILLLSLLDSIPDLIFYKDFDGVYMGCNKAFEEFAGADENSIVGKTDFDMFDEETAAEFRKMDNAMMRNKTQRRNEEIVTYPDGKKAWLETLKTPYFDTDGNILGLIGISRDITERKQKEEKILYLNYHDVLTGLYNRTYFEKVLREEDLAEHLPLTVIIGDINGLKLVNDAFGRDEGDRLLIETAKILLGCCRPGDIIARTGGDEFSIILFNTDENAAVGIVGYIKEKCEKYVAGTDKELYYTSISFGYACKKSLGESLEKVIRKAEEYMSRRKLLEYNSLHSSIISTIKTTLAEKSNETEAHAERIGAMSKKLGQVIGLSSEELVSLELVSTLHDIGKISVDLNILNKPGKLTEDEMEEIRKHPEVGFRIAQTVPELSHIANYILCHHERWDGKGYPQRLKEDGIPLLSRIISIVDSYDAMTHNRPYKNAITKSEAIEEIEKNAGTQFDPNIASVFIEKVLGPER